MAVRQGFTVICISKQHILQKNLQIHRSFFVSYGTHTMNYFASWGFSCVRDARCRGNKIRESFGATISGIVWVAKCSIWLDGGCPEYGRPIKTNAFTPKWFQKLLRPKLVGRKNNYKTLRRSHKFETQNSHTRISPRGVQTAFGFPLLAIFVYLFLCLSSFVL